MPRCRPTRRPSLPPPTGKRPVASPRAPRTRAATERTASRASRALVVALVAPTSSAVESASANRSERTARTARSRRHRPNPGASTRTARTTTATLHGTSSASAPESATPKATARRTVGTTTIVRRAFTVTSFKAEAAGTEISAFRAGSAQRAKGIPTVSGYRAASAPRMRAASVGARRSATPDATRVPGARQPSAGSPTIVSAFRPASTVSGPASARGVAASPACATPIVRSATASRRSTAASAGASTNPSTAAAKGSGLSWNSAAERRTAAPRAPAGSRWSALTRTRRAVGSASA